MAEQAERIGVVGAGLMGAEIAFVFALAGHGVLLNDVAEEALGRAKARLSEIAAKGEARGIFPADQVRGVIERIDFTTDLARFADRDFVVEAVFEDESIKAETWRRLDATCQPGCIFATNTSTIPISNLASHVGPERRPGFIGTHFFSPVSRMKLVEVIPAFDTSEATIETTMRLCIGAGKVPVRVKDVVGFAVNRMLHVFFIEAIRLVEEGVATPEDVDTACKLALGHPVGPFELMDAVTLSLSLQAEEILFDAYGERFRPRPLLKQKVKAGHIGKKAGMGWRVGRS